MLNATIRFPIGRFRQYLALREEHPEWQGDGHDLASVRERLAGMEKRGSASTRWYVPDFLLPSLIRTARRRLMRNQPDNDFLPWVIQELGRAAEIIFKYDPNTDTIDDHMQIRFFACDFPKMIDLLTKAEAKEMDPVTRRHLARFLWCISAARGKTPPDVQAFDRISVRIYTTDIFPFRALLRAMWERGERDNAVYRINWCMKDRLSGEKGKLPEWAFFPE